MPPRLQLPFEGRLRTADADGVAVDAPLDSRWRRRDDSQRQGLEFRAQGRVNPVSGAGWRASEADLWRARRRVDTVDGSLPHLAGSRDRVRRIDRGRTTARPLAEFRRPERQEA